MNILELRCPSRSCHIVVTTLKRASCDTSAQTQAPHPVTYWYRTRCLDKFCRLLQCFNLMRCNVARLCALNQQWWLQSNKIHSLLNFGECQRKLLLKIKHLADWKWRNIFQDVMYDQNRSHGDFFHFTIWCIASHQSHLAEELNSVIIEMAFLWWKTHNERGWISIVGRMQLNKHYAAQTQWYLKSHSKSPSVLARCWRLIRDSALKELFFILSVPLPMKETVGRQWPKEIEEHLPLWQRVTQM